MTQINVEISEVKDATNIAVTISDITTTAVKIASLEKAFIEFRTAPDHMIKACDDLILHEVLNAPFDHFCDLSRAYFTDDDVISHMWENNTKLLIDLCAFYCGIATSKIRIERDVMWLGNETFIRRLEIGYQLYPEGNCPHMPVAANPRSKHFACLIERASCLIL